MPTEYKTARCILRQADRYLLVVHNSASWWLRPRDAAKRWGLPGGRLERNEAPEDAARRELAEELNIHLAAVTPIDAYPYKGSMHMVYGAHFDGEITDFDDTEIVELAWFGVEQIRTLAGHGKLHTGFELDAALAFAAVTDSA